jgi:spectinomycin phosphotransferase
VIVEPSQLPAQRVAASVRLEWDLDVTHAEHLELGAGGWHWVIGDDAGTRWFATVVAVSTSEERLERLTAYEAARGLAHQLSYVCAPVRTRDARIAVDIAPGLLLTLTPFLDGTAGSGPFSDDLERTPVATVLGDLHCSVRPRHLPVWRPRVGWRAGARAADLQQRLASTDWTGGPWSGPAARLVHDARPVVETCLKRFALLGAAVSGNAGRWVVTHGEPHTGNVMTTPDGIRLVDWDTVALAPRERDLREVLAEADGEDPWYAYLGAGGRPEPLSPDTLELFDLQWHLGEIAELAVRLSLPHTDTADTARDFGDLEDELSSLLDGWA